MEYFQARLDSFTPSKPKRTKASSSKQASAAYRWPHPPTWKATPNSLAEAGFYFTPGPDEPDNVTCFMCKKNLCNWEPEDDPFEVHYEKCGDKCAWAVVRCQKPQDNGSYDFSDAARHPTSKTMEKARLDTFAKAEWPHDGVKGHGANSRALAKAGFVWNASEPGDDTAICLYCNLSLGGWDEDDDPYQEHLKRDKKHKTLCAFLKAYTDNSLNKSTAKRPSKTVAKAPPRSASQVLKNTDEEALDASDDELAAATFSGTDPPRASNPRANKSRLSRTSSAPTKTPASRRSTRGTSTGGKTPASRLTVSSEVEDTDLGSESETGKRASKSSRKTGGRTKARVSAIAEEEDEEEPGRTQPDEDVVMQEEDEVQEEEPVNEKRKRGRPPKTTAPAKSNSKGRMKKTEAEAMKVAADSDLDAAPPPPAAKKSHARTRSKANLDSEADAPTKPTHTRTKSGSKAKVKQEEELIPPPAPLPKKKGKQKAAPIVADDEEDVPVPPPKAKGKASRAKIKPEPEGADLDEDVRSGNIEPADDPAHSDQIPSSQPARAPSRRTPSLSDDAGYATAEPPVDLDRMDVDTIDSTGPARPPLTNAHKSAVNGSRSAPRPNGTELVKRPTPPSNDAARQSSVLSSRASSSRPSAKMPPQRVAAKESLKVIEIDSDGEDADAQEAPQPPKATQRPPSAGNLKKPASKASGKKLQVEVVLPPKTARPHQELEDVDMQQASPTSPARGKIARSPSPRAAVKAEPPGTPLSAVHRSAQVSPARPVRDDPEHTHVREPSPKQAVAAPQTYHPVLAQFPIEALTSLTEKEGEMTLEEYIRRETELQYAQFKADAERRIEEFKRRAAEARKLIETS